MTGFRYGVDPEDLTPGQRIEVAFATLSPYGEAPKWIPCRVREVDEFTGRIIIEREDGEYAPPQHPKAIRVPISEDAC